MDSLSIFYRILPENCLRSLRNIFTQDTTKLYSTFNDRRTVDNAWNLHYPNIHRVYILNLHTGPHRHSTHWEINFKNKNRCLIHRDSLFIFCHMCYNYSPCPCLQILHNLSSESVFWQLKACFALNVSVFGYCFLGYLLSKCGMLEFLGGY